VAPGPLRIENWLAAIKAGRTFATNGPLLHFELGGKTAGSELHLANVNKVPFHVELRSIVPVDHLQIVCNGQISRNIDLTAQRNSADSSGTLNIDRSGWCILRAFADRAEYPVLDLYPYATTSPIYFDVGGKASPNTADAQYFVAWVTRLIAAAQQSSAWNTEQEKARVISLFKQAKDKFQQLSR
jgi:hypothetical protein